jgi:hypothetical protein
MQTSSYFSYHGHGRIGISMVAPEKHKEGLIMFYDLAPRPWFKGTGFDIYLDKYYQMLSDLDPKKTWDRLHELVSPYEPVLLCWESPPFDELNFCHRRMVADWFETKLGILVPEREGQD